ncbi:hypothetical protein GRI55_06570 [Erythrobacter citreus]|uniref:Uncharacterized protein n=1 Tax=Qipengyuania citrea TaxID=225971 RepID=A0A6I4UCW0_9SPHN|nr:hypothetical protein [Qipengyuania citrea]MDQ0565556.1 hypothetical protein [Qipengyuania citrea]MXP35434.1 hypothetical protein [Qipengyuania citrea]
MLLKGIVRVVGRSDLEVGKFYASSFPDDEYQVIQIINHVLQDGEQSKLAVIYPQDGGLPSIGEIPSIEVYSEFPEVSIRIDPMSRTGSCFDQALAKGLFIVSGENAILLATPPRNLGWQSFSITASVTLDAHDMRDWCSFSDWKLVTIEGDEEKVLYSAHP